MKTGRRFLQKISMTAILVFMVFCVTMAGLAVCMGSVLAYYQQTLEQNARISSEQSVGQVASTVEVYARDMGQSLDFLMQALDGEEKEEDAVLLSFLQGRPDIVAVTSYDDSGRMTRCWSIDRTLRKNILQNLSFSREQAPAAGRSISAPHVESIFEGSYPWVVTMVQRLDGADDRRFLAMDLSFTRISDCVDQVGIGQHGYCYIMDADGGIVYHPQQQLLYAGLKEEDTAGIVGLADGSYVGENLIRSICTVPSCGWRIVGVSYQNEMVADQMARMTQIALGTCLVILLATGACGLILSRILSRPLRRLSGAMKNFEQDADHYVYQPVSGTVEVSTLSDAFGHMVLRIQSLMARVREEEVELRKAELKALQAQINPHFLYNTLDSIAWMCEQGRNGEAVHMVNALATLFRISISRGKEFITVERELEHAKSYLEIQKYRYKNQFSCSFEVDADCLSCYCCKITLQPILENSITHGLGPAVDDGFIRVRVYREDSALIFLVQDNGVGMEQSVADALLEKESGEKSGIGLKNVHNRIRIYFGEEYGLQITSEPDVGTVVKIRMPLLTEEDIREGDLHEK